MSDERAIPAPIDGAQLGRNIIENAGSERDKGLGIEEFFGESGHTLRYAVNPKLLGITQLPSYDGLPSGAGLSLRQELTRGINSSLREVWKQGIQEIEVSSDPRIKIAAEEAYSGGNETLQVALEGIADTPGKSVIRAIGHLTRIRFLQALRAEQAAQTDDNNDFQPKPKNYFQLKLIDKQIDDSLAAAATLLALEARDPIVALFEDTRVRVDSLREQSSS